MGTNTNDQTNNENEGQPTKLRFSDEACFDIIMKNPEIASRVIEAIFSDEVEDIKSDDTEKFYTGKLKGKEVRFDVHMIADYGQTTDDERQLSPAAILDNRFRYYQTLIDGPNLCSIEGYANLCENYIVFITTYDPYGSGRAFYEIDWVETKSKIVLDTGAHTIVLNSSAWDDETIAPALSDLLCYTYTGKVKGEGTLSSVLDEEVRKLNDKVFDAASLVTAKDKMETGCASHEVSTNNSSEESANNN